MGMHLTKNWNVITHKDMAFCPPFGPELLSPCSHYGSASWSSWGSRMKIMLYLRVIFPKSYPTLSDTIRHRGPGEWIVLRDREGPIRHYPTLSDTTPKRKSYPTLSDTGALVNELFWGTARDLSDTIRRYPTHTPPLSDIWHYPTRPATPYRYPTLFDNPPKESRSRIKILGVHGQYDHQWQFLNGKENLRSRDINPININNISSIQPTTKQPSRLEVS